MMVYDYAARYGFRPRRAHESPEAYRDALIAFVDERDLSAAHELRVGRRQAEWTPADVAAFQATAMAPGRRQPRQVGIRGEVLFGDHEQIEPTEAAALALFDRGLGRVREMREDKPEAPLPLFAVVVLFTGEAISCVFTDRGDRVAVIKALARNLPVFAFCVIGDAFIHAIRESDTATKTDALIAQIGTREWRIVRARPYHVEAGRAVFDPPPADIDSRTTTGRIDGDVYAEIFVSVPPSAAPPS